MLLMFLPVRYFSAACHMLCCVTKGFKLNSDLEQKLCLVLAALNFTNFKGTANAVHQQQFRKAWKCFPILINVLAVEQNRLSNILKTKK